MHDSGSKRKHIPILVKSALGAFGQRVAAARKARHVTQTELAHLADVGLSTVVSIEGGHDGVSVGNLFKVLDALDELPQMELLLNPRQQQATLLKLVSEQLGRTEAP